jgi:hypothetical protein
MLHVAKAAHSAVRTDVERLAIAQRSLRDECCAVSQHCAGE